MFELSCFPRVAICLFSEPFALWLSSWAHEAAAAVSRGGSEQPWGGARGHKGCCGHGDRTTLGVTGGSQLEVTEPQGCHAWAVGRLGGQAMLAAGGSGVSGCFCSVSAPSSPDFTADS